MKKKLLYTIGAIVLAALLLVGGFPLFSRLVYGRSQAATLLAWQLKKESYTTEEAFQSYLEEKRAINGSYYDLPYSGWRSGRPEIRPYGGLTTYLLNGAAAPRRLVIYLPGGSFIDKPRTVHWQFLDTLAADADAAVVLPLYPLLPQADASQALTSLTEFYQSFMTSHETEELILMGDSAGGGLALSFAMTLRDIGLQRPYKMILLSPWLDVTLSDPEIPAYEKKDPALDSEQLRHLGTLWAGDLEPTDPQVSPLYGSPEGLCPIALFTGTAELLYPDIMALDARLTMLGAAHETIVQPGMFHVWPLYLAYHIPEADAAYSQILRIIAE